jgi:signal transduction histidine kinase
MEGPEPHRIPATPETSTLGSILTSEGFDRSDARFESEADKALMERPRFDIRMRLWLAFGLFFLYSLGTTLWAIDMLADLEHRILFLEAADDYMSEIQQARRYEKTFLLYGTNLADAQESAHNATRLFDLHAGRFRSVIGAAALDTLSHHLDAYTRIIDTLDRERPGVEEDLRIHGAELVRSALEYAGKERARLDTMLAWARRIPLILLGVLLVLMTLVITFLYRHIHGTLSRFALYTERIAAGDFTPITPTREYRDEFSTLAVMINRMMRALDRQHRILVESHKLRAMGTLVAGVAHEINNPINNMLLTASVLEEECSAETPPAQREMLEDLIKQAERAKNIVRNLLDFARESETRIKPVELRRIVEQTVKLVRNQARVRKVRITAVLGDSLPLVHGDEQLLEQVVMNLLLNAIEALPEGGEVTVRSDPERREGYLALDIADNGPGIPEHVMSRIFDPFFTTKPKGKGTGLGLSVSRGIVRKLGGYLFVQSRLGEGSLFTVLLPVTTVPSEISATRRDTEAGPGPRAGAGAARTGVATTPAAGGPHAQGADAQGPDGQERGR